MSWITTVPRTLVLLVSLGALTADSVLADSYRWVDHQGVVHFTEDPPPPGSAQRVERIGENPGEEASARPAGGTLRGEAYQGKEPSRLIGLEKVGVQIKNTSAKPLQIGTACGRALTSHDATSWVGGISWQSGFYGRLEQLGYQTPNTDKTLRFSNEPARPVELSIIGAITGLRVDGCATVRNLRVEWRVFDNLQRKVVYETITEGSDELRNTQDPRRSMLEAFVSSANRLFADARFRELMTPRDPKTAAVPAAMSSNSDAPQAPLSLPLRYGSTSSTFRDERDRIKQASVTVRTAAGHGSGFLLADGGYVLTNQHVVAGSDRVMVIFEHRQIGARPIRSDAVRDVALLKLDSDPAVPPLQIARTHPVEGDALYVVGTPLDEKLSLTVTKGILSAVRELEQLSYYQTDAAINPGNSGGPAFDAFGQVVGISVAGLVRNGASLDINLLIPIDDALRSLKIGP